MSQLIHDLLKLSRVARAEMNVQQVNLGELFKHLAAQLREADPARNVQFVIAEEVTAHGDKGLLRVVLENLISNAWKYSSKQAEAALNLVFPTVGMAGRCISCVTTGPDSTWPTPRSYSAHSSASTPTMTFLAPASAWQRCSALFTGMGAGFGQKALSDRVLHSISVSDENIRSARV